MVVWSSSLNNHHFENLGVYLKKMTPFFICLTINFNKEVFMNKEQFKGNWKEIKGKIKEKWGKLTDDDIIRIEGKYEQLRGALEKKYGYEKEEAEKEIDNLCKSCKESKSWK